MPAYAEYFPRPSENWDSPCPPSRLIQPKSLELTQSDCPLLATRKLQASLLGDRSWVPLAFHVHIPPAGDARPLAARSFGKADQVGDNTAWLQIAQPLLNTQLPYLLKGP